MDLFDEVSRSDDAEKAIFRIVPTDLTFKSTASIVSMAKRGDIFYIALKNNTILYFDGRRQDQAITFTLPKVDTNKDPGRINEVYLSPCGNHVLVTLVTGENYYMHRPKMVRESRTKFVQIKSIKSMISAVAWDQNKKSELALPDFLVGTKSGEVHLCSITSSGGFSSKKLIALPEVIRGMNFDVYPSSGSGKDLFAVVSTNSRVYTFSGADNLTELFTNYSGGDFNYQQFYFGEDVHKIAQRGRFSVLHLVNSVGYGLVFPEFGFFFEIKYTEGKPVPAKNENMITSGARLEYPERWPLPKMIATKYHYVFLYPKKIYCVSRYTGKRVFEAQPPGGSAVFLGFSTSEFDALEDDSITLFTASGVMNLTIGSNEGTYMWKHFLDKGEFDEAIYVTKNLPKERVIVMIEYGNFLFNQGDLRRAASLYRQSGVPMEIVIEKFKYPNNREFFLEYFSQAIQYEVNSIDLTIQIMYVMDILLVELLEAEKRGSSEDAEAWMEEIKSFLDKYYLDIDETIAESLFRRHGRENLLTQYFLRKKDLRSLVGTYIHGRKYMEALRCVRDSSDIELIYRYSPDLMFNIPQETIKMWQRFRHKLTISRLLPALMRYESSGQDVKIVISYLENLVLSHKNTEPPIHDYLIYLYCKTGGYEDSLIKFLRMEIYGKRYYNVETALRLCKKYNYHKSTVYLFSELGLFDELVDLLIKTGDTDLDLAMGYISKCDNRNTRKRLWLKLISTVVDEGFEKIARFIKESNGDVGIEEVFPMLNDSVVIGDLRDEITKFIKKTTKAKNKLKKQMEAMTETSQVMRRDLKKAKEESVVIRSTNICDICGLQLGNVDIQHLSVYPCEHRFHRKCVWKFYAGLDVPKYREGRDGILSVSDRKRLQKLLGTKDINVTDEMLDDPKVSEILDRGCPVCGLANVELVRVEYLGTDRWKI